MMSIPRDREGSIGNSGGESMKRVLKMTLISAVVGGLIGALGSITRSWLVGVA